MSLVRAAHGWWRARARRERAMLALMCAALAAFGYWYGLLLPMRAFQEASRQRHEDAAHALSAVAADLEAIAALRTRGPAPPPEGAIADVVLGAAREAGIAVSRQRTDGDGALVLGIDATDGGTLFGWLDGLRREHGIGPLRLRIGKADGRLRAEVAFAPAFAPGSGP